MLNKLLTCVIGKSFVRASPAVVALSTSPAKKIKKKKFTSKFSYVAYLFCNPTHETETGTANRSRTTNRKPPGRTIMINQSEILSSSQINHIYLTLFCRCIAVPFCHPLQTNCAIMLSQNHFVEPD